MFGFDIQYLEFHAASGCGSAGAGGKEKLTYVSPSLRPNFIVFESADGKASMTFTMPPLRPWFESREVLPPVLLKAR